MTDYKMEPIRSPGISPSMKMGACILCLTAACFSAAQGSISLFGQMSVSEGGLGFVQGKVRDSGGVAVGNFKAQFTTGSLVSVEANRLTSIFVPTLTAGFEGIATALIRDGSVTTTATGRFHVYVDDLSGLTPPHPDQMILTFQPRVGPMLVRHGLMQRGDIVVTP